MLNQATDNRLKMQAIRKRYLSGQISYDQAKIEAQPLINSINQQAKAIAKRHNMPAPKISFAAIMR